MHASGVHPFYTAAKKDGSFDLLTVIPTALHLASARVRLCIRAAQRPSHHLRFQPGGADLRGTQMRTATLKATGSGRQEPLLRAGDRGDGPLGNDDGVSFGCGPWTYTHGARGCPPPTPSQLQIRVRSVRQPTTTIRFPQTSSRCCFAPALLLSTHSGPSGPQRSDAHAVNTPIPSTAPAEPPAAVPSPFL